MDCELRVEKALMAILSIERDVEEYEDEWMCWRMIRWWRGMKWLLFDLYIHALGRCSQQQPSSHGHGSSLTNGSAPSSLTSGPIPAQPFPPTSQAPVSVTAEQIGALCAQIYTFKLITRGQPVPEHIQQAIQVPNNAVADLEKMLHGPDIPSRIVDAAVKVTKGESSTATLPISVPEDLVKAEELDSTPINPADYPKGNFLEDNINSGIDP